MFATDIDDARSGKARPRAPSVGVLILTAMLVFATVFGAIELTNLTGRISDVWLANSLVMAILLKFPRHAWWKVLLAAAMGNIAADLLAGDTLFGTAVFSFANLVEVLAVAWPLRSWGLDAEFSRPHSLLIFYPLAGAAPIVSAAIAATYFHDGFGMAFLQSARSWYSADALGLVIVAPMLLTVRASAFARMFSRRQIGGTALLLAVLGSTIALNYLLWDYPLAFLFFPAVMLLTFQRSFEGGAVGLAMTSLYLTVPLFIASSTSHLHPHSLNEQMLIVQTFVASIGFSVVVVGAALEERKRLERGLASALVRVEMSREEALVARDAAEKANRAKSMFLANMSHELRTPLNAIIGFAEVMNSEMYGRLGDPHYREYTGMIHGAGHHLLELINDILDMSKIEAGKFEIQRESLSLGALLMECVELMQDRADAAEVSLDADVPAQPLPLYADRKAIKQILFNLLSNAIKFTPAGGNVVAKAWRDGGQVILCVSDTGIGIPADQITRLGNPFVQLRSHAGTSQIGTGLGLALVRSLVEMHHGDFRIDSVEGEGTNVTVRISAAKAVELAA
ncbi:MAG TPA: ATP-binding protein [Rhizomicrobium sp.]|jgi:signal transduction histidine kinase